MSDYVKRATGVADQYLTALAESQEQFLKNLTAFSALVPKVPANSVPEVFGELPTPKEVVEANFGWEWQSKATTHLFIESNSPTHGHERGFLSSVSLKDASAQRTLQVPFKHRHQRLNE